MLDVEDIHTYYGDSYVLHGVSIRVEAGQVVALLGRNGAGKTTTLRSIIGLTPPRAGHIRFRGEVVTGRKPHALARLGLSYLPETRGIFPSLTVSENLAVAAGRRPGPWTRDRVLDLFPKLRERRRSTGSTLSGGEQQMLAIARALLLNPDLLILDEPTEGLAPIIVGEIKSCLADLKDSGLTILLVEQNLRFALELADHVYVLGNGQVQWDGAPADLVADTEVHETWLGV